MLLLYTRLTQLQLWISSLLNQTTKEIYHQMVIKKQELCQRGPSLKPLPTLKIYITVFMQLPLQPAFLLLLHPQNTEKVVSQSVQPMPLEEQLRDGDQRQISSTEPSSNKRLPVTDRTNKHFSQDHVDA